MKKIFLTVAVFLCGLSVFGQENEQMLYRRSSLYTIMIPDEDLLPEAKGIVMNTFTGMPLPSNYNNHNLLLRDLSLIYNNEYQVTQAEIDAASGQGAKKASKVSSFLKGASSEAASAATGTEVTVGRSDAEYVARLTKYFDINHVAHNLIEKWYNFNPQNKLCDLNLINERGLYNASQEELDVAHTTKSGMNKIQDAAAMDLIPKTFVMVTRYSYLPAQDIINMVAGPATVAAAQAGGPAGEVAAATMATLSESIRGYFVKTSTYLFRLKWNAELQAKVENDPSNGGYWGETFDIDAFRNDESFTMEYVGKTWSYAPATLKLSFEPGVDDKLIAKATVRATDKSLAQLQRKYSEFRPMSTLQVNDAAKECYAYIGKKEDIQEDDQFEVLEARMDAEGVITYKRIAKIKPLKGMIWDNRYGADEVLPGEIVEKDENQAGASSTTLTYTSFSFNKKLMSGMLIRQCK